MVSTDASAALTASSTSPHRPWHRSRTSSRLDVRNPCKPQPESESESEPEPEPEPQSSLDTRSATVGWLQSHHRSQEFGESHLHARTEGNAVIRESLQLLQGRPSDQERELLLARVRAVHRKLSAAQWRALLRAAARDSLWLVTSLYDLQCTLATPPAGCFHEVIWANVVQKRWPDAFRLFTEYTLRADKPVPYAATVRRLLVVMCHARPPTPVPDVWKLWRVFKVLRLLGSCRAEDWTLVISAAIDQNELEIALQWYASAAKEVVPTTPLFNTKLRALALRGVFATPQELQTLLDEMKQLGLAADADTHMHILRVHAVQTDTTALMQCFHGLKAGGAALSAQHYRFVLRALLKQGDPEPLILLHGEMQSQLLHDARSFEAVLSFLAHKQLVNSMVAVLDEAKAAKISLTLGSYALVLRALEGHHRWGVVLDLFAELKQRQLLPQHLLSHVAFALDLVDSPSATQRAVRSLKHGMVYLEVVGEKQLRSCIPPLLSSVALDVSNLSHDAVECARRKEAWAELETARQAGLLPVEFEETVA